MSAPRRGRIAARLGLFAALSGQFAGPAPAGDLRPETDRPYAGSGSIPLGGERVLLDGRRLLRADGEVLADGLHTDPVGDGGHLCAADEAADGLGRLRCWNGDFVAVVLAVGGRPGRLAMGPGMVAWVASPEGYPQVTVAAVDGSTPPRALTNVGLQRTPGRAPAGFVEPPLGASLRFDGDLLRWDAPSGPVSVRWRE